MPLKENLYPLALFPVCLLGSSAWGRIFFSFSGEGNRQGCECCSDCRGKALPKRKVLQYFLVLIQSLISSGSSFVTLVENTLSLTVSFWTLYLTESQKNTSVLAIHRGRCGYCWDLGPNPFISLETRASTVESGWECSGNACFLRGTIWSIRIISLLLIYAEAQQ